MILTECPRDAMQGWGRFIPTADKIDYINSLLSVGFDVLDCGSFVSPKAIPQMADTAEVLSEIDRGLSSTKISVIVANVRGAEQALAQPQVDCLGFPFSLSKKFQYQDTNKTQAEAYQQIREIIEIARIEGKEFCIYISMAFGNPYGEDWHQETLLFWIDRFVALGGTNITLADTAGVATREQIRWIFQTLANRFPNLYFGVHFHSRYSEAYIKLKAAYDAGCRRFNSSIKGLGGYPLAKEDVVGNIPTEQVFNFMNLEKIPIKQNMLHFESAWNKAKSIFKF